MKKRRKKRLLVPNCNRCHKPAPYSFFKFEITEKSITGNIMEHFDGPDTRLDDFHLCPQCMSEFTDFVKAGKKDDK